MNDYRSQRALLRAFGWAVHNQSEMTLLDAAYGTAANRHPDYIKEKVAILRRRPLDWFTTLDATNQTRFLAWLDATYGEEAEHHVASITPLEPETGRDPG